MNLVVVHHQNYYMTLLEEGKTVIFFEYKIPRSDSYCATSGNLTFN